MNKKVSNKITYLNFVLAFMILNLHSAYMSLFKTTDIVLLVNQIVRVICNMAVPTFFYVSAMLFYRSCEKKKYIDVIRKKIKTLLLLYICWNIVCLPLKEFKNYKSGLGFSFTSPLELLGNIFSSSYDPVLWFIRVLFIYFLFYPVNLFILKKKRLYPWIIALIFVINIIIGPTVGYATCRYWLPVYMVGSYIGYWYNDKVFEQNRVNPRYLWIGLAIIIQIILVFWAVQNSYGLFICRMVSPILYWIIADIFLISKSPKWVFKQTFFYYCAQMIFSIVAQKIYLFVFGKGVVSAILSNVGIPIILLGILVIVAFLFNKTMPRIYGFMTGGRA